MVLAACGAGGCARTARPVAADTDSPVFRPPDFRDSEKELAALAADVSRGLQERLEADEPLTPQFAQLLGDWSRRAYVHRTDPFRPDADYAGAAREYWE
jgi:hypothetical protein